LWCSLTAQFLPTPKGDLLRLSPRMHKIGPNPNTQNSFRGKIGHDGKFWRGKTRVLEGKKLLNSSLNYYIIFGLKKWLIRLYLTHPWLNDELFNFCFCKKRKGNPGKSHARCLLAAVENYGLCNFIIHKKVQK